jgi:spermidine/putrescine transport system substrate-binding protein
MMRFKILFILPALFLLILAGCQSSDKARSRVLKIYNWSDYIDEQILVDFPVWYKEQTGEDLKIVYQVFDMNEVMYTKIVLGQEDFDLACPTQAVIERMLKRDLLLPISADIDSSNYFLDNISPFIQTQVNHFSTEKYDANRYIVPYMWGISGILYNPKFVDRSEVQSWDCMWNPKNKGKILMKDSYWDAYNMAVINAFHHEADNTDSLYIIANRHSDTDIGAVEERLKELKPNLAGWEADFGKEMMTKGKLWLSYAWSGDAVWSIEEAASVGVDLDFEVPLEGSNIWFDGWVIPKYARNIKAATYFLNYICRPEMALLNMDVSGYSSAVATPEILEEMLDSTFTRPVNLSYLFGEGHDSVFINPIRYPDEAEVNRCVLIHDFLDKNDEVLEMWSRAKGDSLNTGMAVLILSFFLLLIAVFVYRKAGKALRARRRIRHHKLWQ